MVLVFILTNTISFINHILEKTKKSVRHNEIEWI